MEHTALIEYLRRKVAETPDKAGMAEVANCTRDTLHKFAGGTIQELKYSILMGLQEYFEKTAKEGPGKKLRPMFANRPGAPNGSSPPLHLCSRWTARRSKSRPRWI